MRAERRIERVVKQSYQRTSNPSQTHKSWSFEFFGRTTAPRFHTGVRAILTWSRILPLLTIRFDRLPPLDTPIYSLAVAFFWKAVDPVIAKATRTSRSALKRSQSLITSISRIAYTEGTASFLIQSTSQLTRLTEHGRIRHTLALILRILSPSVPTHQRLATSRTRKQHLAINPYHFNNVVVNITERDGSPSPAIPQYPLLRSLPRRFHPESRQSRCRLQ